MFIINILIKSYPNISMYDENNIALTDTMVGDSIAIIQNGNYI